MWDKKTVKHYFFKKKYFYMKTRYICDVFNQKIHYCIPDLHI